MRTTAIERDWTKGSIIRNLLSLSWPVLISQILNMIGPTIDMIWVGRLGAASIAGVGIAGIMVILSSSATMGLATGMRALVARFVGTGDRDGASHVSNQAFIIAIGYSIIVAAIGISLAEPILRAFGVEADVVREGAAYLRVMFIGGIAMSLRMMAEGSMNASGDTITPMIIAVIFRVVHVAVCPFLVFGWWIFPDLGVSGAAATNIVSQGLGLVLSLWVLSSGRTRLRLTWKNVRLDPGIIWRMVKIGLPTLIMNIQHHLCTLVLILLITPFGTLAVAGHTLWERVDLVLMTISMSFGLSAGVLAGQNLGAGQQERAERGGWLAVGIVSGCMLVGSLVVLLWAEGVVGIFSTDPGLVEVGSAFLRIAAVGYVALGINLYFMHFLTSVGDTMTAMMFELIANWLGQVMLAWVLSRYTPFGVYGIRWAMVIGTVIAAVIFVIYFWRGRWKRKRV